MVDITNKLVTQSAQRVVNTPVPAKDNFLPEIPSANVDTALPAAVLNALGNVQTQTRSQINNERTRLNKTMDATKEANIEIDAAQRRLQEINDSPLLDFMGIHDSRYNKAFQRNRAAEAKRKLEGTINQLSLESQRDALDLRESSLPLDAYIKTTELQGKKAALSAQQANAIIQSNAARKQYRAQLQLGYTDEQIEHISKTGSYNSVWTAQDVKKYRDDKAVWKENMEASKLANASNRLKLSENIQTRALAQMPIPYAKSLVASAVKEKRNLIQIAPNVTVPTSLLQKTLALKMKQQDEDFATTAQSQLQIVKNDGEMSAMLSNVVTASSIFTGNGFELSNLPTLNMLNITEETIKDFPIESIHPTLRPGFQTVLGAAAILNEKSQPTRDASGKIIKQAEGVTTQDVFTFKQTINDMNAQALQLHTNIIDTAVDKGSKAAYTEWFANRRMQTQDNSAAMLVSNIISLPNLGNDTALQAMHQTLIENISKDILEGEDIDFASLSEEERTNVIFKSIADSGFKGKITSRDKVIKGLHAKNSRGQTPKDAYVDSRILEITDVSMSQLSEAHPEYATFFSQLRSATGFVNPSALAGTLAELSFKLKQQNPELKDLSLNFELLDIMNQYVDSNKVKWDAQLNPVRGSLMNLGFNSNPSQLVDTALTTQFGSASRQAWQAMPEEAEQQRIRQHIRGDIDFGDRESGSVFSPIPLPQ